MKFPASKTTLILIIVLFISATSFQMVLFGQSTLNYSIGFLPNIGGLQKSQPVFSYPILFSDNQKCLNLNNGLSKYLRSSGDAFSFSCTIDNDLRSLEFKVFPNPSNGTSITVMLTEKIFGVQDKLIIKVIGYNGVSYISYNAQLEQLVNGKNLSLPYLPSGVYIVNITSEQNKMIGNQKLIIVK